MDTLLLFLSPNLRTINWHWICALAYITESVTWMCFTDCRSIVFWGKLECKHAWILCQKAVDWKNGTCNKAGFWSVPHLVLLRWVLMCAWMYPKNLSPWCQMEHPKCFFVPCNVLVMCVCATGGCFSCYSALRSNSLDSRKIAMHRHLNITRAFPAREQHLLSGLWNLFSQ